MSRFDAVVEEFLAVKDEQQPIEPELALPSHATETEPCKHVLVGVHTACLEAASVPLVS